MIIVAVVALALVGFLGTALVAPLVHSDTRMNSVRAGMSIGELHATHPGMKSLPVQDAPLP